MLSAKLQFSGTPSVFEPNLALVPEQASDTPDGMAQITPVTFAARYCMHRGIKLEDFEEQLFRRALYFRARWLRPLLERKRDYFATDRAFIGMVGRATNLREVESAMSDFADFRGPHRFLKKRLKLRVSASIVWMLAHRLLKEELPPAPTRYHSQSPFPARVSAWRESAPTVGTSNQAAARASRAMEEVEIARLRQEVARLSAQCDLLKRAMGLFCETKPPPAAS